MTFRTVVTSVLCGLTANEAINSFGVPMPYAFAAAVVTFSYFLDRDINNAIAKEKAEAKTEINL